MSEIHLLLPNGEQRIQNEEEMSALLREGVLPAESLFWREGMGDWEPLRNLIVRAAAPPRRVGGASELPERPVNDSDPDWSPPLAVSSAEPIRKRRTLRRNPEPLSSITALLLLGAAGVAVCNLVLDLPFAFSDISHPVLPDDSAAHLAEKRHWLLIYLGVSTLACLCFLIWVKRSYTNCRGLVGGLRFPTAWSIGYYITPILCFFRPQQMMQEIWKVSARPWTWQNNPGSLLVLFWWGNWLADWLMSPVSCTIFYPDFDAGYETFISQETMLLLQDINFVLVSLSTALLVIIISLRQKRLTRSK